MAMTETSYPTTSLALDASVPPNHSQSLPTLTPLTASRRPWSISHAPKHRLSQYLARSRPQSPAFPMPPLSPPYTLVRDFAYPVSHPMHYGPPPEPSGPPSDLNTPANEHTRLSDPPASWEQTRPCDAWAAADALSHANDIPPIQFGDGPPYSEDDDLQSPVVATRHRKHKSTASGAGRPRTGSDLDHSSSAMMSSPAYNETVYFVGRAEDGSEQYYVSQGGEANGPGGGLVTYPPDQPRQSRSYHFAPELRQAGSKEDYASGDSSCTSSPGYHEEDQSRYSRDYQFTITSPDEEFHGKAVALFDFERENENELPLAEGQIIWVSYRHGQGWLVAEDPKTQESGLVPEEYVRLLRDIEGGMNSLTGQVGDGVVSPTAEAGTPTQAEHANKEGPQQAGSHAANGYHQPVVSVFSTSSKDLNPYPTEQLGIQAGQAPPQVVHYHGQRGGSQANTPTLAQHGEAGSARRGSQESSPKEEGGQLETSQGADFKTAATEDGCSKAAVTAAETTMTMEEAGSEAAKTDCNSRETTKTDRRLGRITSTVSSSAKSSLESTNHARRYATESGSAKTSAATSTTSSSSSSESGGGGGQGKASSSSTWLSLAGAAFALGGCYWYMAGDSAAQKAAAKVKQVAGGAATKAALTGGDQGFVSLKLKDVETVNHNTKRFRFELPESDMVSGLHVASAVLTKFKGEGDEKPTVRPYTPVSDEDEQGHIDLLIKKYSGGPMSSYLHDMQPGQTLDFKGPLPKYPWAENKHEHIGLIAGGTGITPMYQLLRTIFSNPNDKTKVTLVFGNVSEEDILLRKELIELENTYPQRFRAFYVLDKAPKGKWSGATGFITKDLLKSVLPEPKDENVKLFVCGPPGLMKAVSGGKNSPKDQGELTGALKELGYSKDQVYKF
ncbi:hypothetical protein CP533_5436, partial [Ophiocordyceps camponoti-saundersi (nom. inval.)]